jgi:uncharacterized protein with NRDE domain
MCLIAWDWQPKSSTRLLLLSNRDEFYARPDQALHWWDGEQILAGKDLQGGGTWLGVSRSGRLAALTNYRDPTHNNPAAPTRGALVTNFLQSEQAADTYLASLASQTDHYNPFNLLVYDGQQMLGLESRHRKVVPMSAGVGGVSNADFDTPWPKLQTLKQGLQSQLVADATDTEALLALLQNSTPAADADLPHTGIPLELERTLSAAFIRSPAYGTRASSVIRISNTGSTFTELRFGATGVLGRYTVLSGLLRGTCKVNCAP